MARQVLPPETPFGIPYLAINSSTGSSRLAVSALGAEFDVRFYGDFSGDRARCFEYLRRKLNAAMRGWQALDLQPAFFGLVVSVNFPFGDDDNPVEFLVSRHTRYEVPGEDLQEALVRVSLKVQDMYFLTLTLANYETKEIERAVFPGARSVQVKPWEGRISGSGLQLAVDVNNRLSAIQSRQDLAVGEREIDEMVALSERVLERAGAAFVETGTVNLEELAREQA